MELTFVRMECQSFEGEVSKVRDANRVGFTLVELLVAIAIIGLLAGLVLPAIQGAREASRRMSCSNNIRNQTLAILDFERIFTHLPPGRMGRNDLDHAWSFYLLPMLEQTRIYSAYDLGKPMDAPANTKLAQSVLPVYRCPSSEKNMFGDTDYAGLSGTVINLNGQSPFNRGSLVFVYDSLGDDYRYRPSYELPLSSVTDGLSNTFCIAESPDRPAPDGSWASGINCISHDRGSVNNGGDGIRSLHVGGAHCARLDGSLTFVSNGIDENALGAMLTRNGNEYLSID